MTLSGREVDVRVAKEQGWIHQPSNSEKPWILESFYDLKNQRGYYLDDGPEEFRLPHFSTDDPVALELFKETGELHLICRMGDGRWGCTYLILSSDGITEKSVISDTIAHAVCLAFLEGREGK